MPEAGKWFSRAFPESVIKILKSFVVFLIIDTFVFIRSERTEVVREEILKDLGVCLYR